ncbi:MAG: hypothetical protein NW216_03435 [Hyphomicrobium sp.]|nr:hypothetical protein [Hyphomicrobium sp.]
MIEIHAFDPMTLVMIAVFNPATALTGFIMGRHADQWQKVIIAALAASLAGFVLYWLAAQVGVFRVTALGGEAGMVLIGCGVGLVWALIGYLMFRRTPAT